MPENPGYDFLEIFAGNKAAHEHGTYLEYNPCHVMYQIVDLSYRHSLREV